MKGIYIKPYKGEEEIVKDLDTETKWHFAESLEDVPEDFRNDAEVLSVFVDFEVTKEVIESLPKLSIIATRSAGYDHIDMETAKEKDIVIYRVPHYGSQTVAEYAFALMFSLSRNVPRAYSDLRQNALEKDLETYEGFDLSGKTLGVIGTGSIGSSVCKIANGFGMKVLAHDIKENPECTKLNNLKYCELDELLKNSDVVTLHVPALPETEKLIGEKEIAMMKAGAYLINTSRGVVVDTRALVTAIKEERLAGAGLDVLEGEKEMQGESEWLSGKKTDPETFMQLAYNYALIDLPNVVVTPHIAFNTKEAKREITETTINNLKAFKAGDSENQVTFS